MDFVCWMMGLPEGWVDGLTRTAALRCLGNAVVPQQGAHALAQLIEPAADLLSGWPRARPTETVNPGRAL